MGTVFSGVIAKIALVTAAIVIAGGAAAGGAIAVGGHSAASHTAATESAVKAGLTLPVTNGDDSSGSATEPSDLSGRTAPSLPDQASENAKGVINTVFGTDPHTGADFGAAVSTEASDGKSGGTGSDGQKKATTSTSERPDK